MASHFDTVNNEIYHVNESTLLGVSNTNLKWFLSYLIAKKAMNLGNVETSYANYAESPKEAS